MRFPVKNNKQILTYEEEKAVLESLRYVILNNKTKDKTFFQSAFLKVNASFKEKEKLMSAKRKEVSKSPKDKVYKRAKHKKSIYERLEELVFFNPGDEAGELFQATCNLCYLMAGFGEEEKVETLYSWAKEQAEFSKKWAEENQTGFDNYIKGY